MENLTHTLFGLVLAEAGLENVTPLATTTLVVASNLPDIDFLMTLRGGSLSYIKYHRGLTHTFVGVVMLAIVLTLVMTYLDRRLRLKGDPFRRPARPWRIFWLAVIGGLGHLALDFTNAYGLRPLFPFDRHWYYGDLIFIADPWIWLILGGAAAWVTLRAAAKKQKLGGVLLFWLLVGGGTGAVMAMALKNGSEYTPAIPNIIRIAWFCGLAVVAFGAIMRWGDNGRKVARWALVLLAFYYSGMWMAHQSAIQEAKASPPSGGINYLAAWPEPANPSLWDAVGYSTGSSVPGAKSSVSVDDRDLSLLPSWVQSSLPGWLDPPLSESGWRTMSPLDPKFRDALNRTDAGRTFLGFARYPRAKVEELPGGYRITVSDSRFSLRLHADLDLNLNVKSASVSWF